jgi:hypothetical protein
MTQFPQITAACAEIKHWMAIRNQQEKDKLRSRWRYPEEEAARDRVRLAYAEEMLAPILGSKWKPSTRSTITTRGRKNWGYPRWHEFGRPLFDHTDVYRQVGARGPNTWENCCAVSHPYGALDKDGKPLDGALNHAGGLAIEGLGTWVRKDLSSWYPGWTQLVIVAKGLPAAQAAKYGFIALADPCSPVEVAIYRLREVGMWGLKFAEVRRRILTGLTPEEIAEVLDRAERDGITSHDPPLETISGRWILA